MAKHAQVPQPTVTGVHIMNVNRTLLPMQRICRRAVLGSLMLGLLAVCNFAAAKDGGGGGGDAEVAGEILLRLGSTANLAPLLAKYPVSLLSQFGSRPIYRLKMVGTANTAGTLAALQLEPGVLIAEPNFANRSPEARQASAWAIGSPQAYATQWAPAALRLPLAHTLSTGTGVRVAVLDSGVDATHPALAGRLLPGFDFVDFDTDPAEVGSPTTHPSFGHGTHVAGIVAMVAPGAKIMPLRVLDADGSGNAWVLAEALLYAVDPDRNPATNDGAHVINLSLGTLNRTRVLQSVAQLSACALPAVIVEPLDDFSDPGYNPDKDRCSQQGGAVIVAAAGNDGSRALRQYPAAEGVYGLLAVGASNRASVLSGFSNYGSWVDVAAPGQNITSTVPGAGFGTWSGTSMAAPMASGVAALLRAREPGLSPRDVTRRLTRISANLCSGDMRRIDAAAALENRMPAPAVCP
jgi:subtilisin family serine protease